MFIKSKWLHQATQVRFQPLVVNNEMRFHNCYVKFWAGGLQTHQKPQSKDDSYVVNVVARSTDATDLTDVLYQSD